MDVRRKAGWLEMMRLVVITSPGGHRSHEQVTAAALEAGCRAIQLRDKTMTDRELAGVARRIRDECDMAGSLFFVDDRVDVALAVRADGVHLGVDDLAVADARRLLGPGALIGYSPEGKSDAAGAVCDGADYLGIGPVFSTSTKPDAGDPIGGRGVAEYALGIQAPVIAVGGITAANARAALDRGAAGVAVAAAVSGAEDMGAAVREMLEALSRPRGPTRR